MTNPDPDKCARAIEGAIDKYVKQRARNTIALSAERDPACAGYARIPGPDACDFCVTMGAANDFYHTRDSAGGGSGHGTADDHYHPYCNCQVCIVFDKKGKLVARDPDTGEVVPYDAADMMRRYDEAGHPTFAKPGARSGSRSGGSGKPAVLSEKEFDVAIQQLSEASTVEELHAAGERVVSIWKAGKAGRDEIQWRHMSKFAQDREKELRGKSVAVEGGSSSASATTRVVNPASEFMGKMEEREFHELIETRFGCKVTDGFRGLPIELKRPLMADLEAVFSDFPEARAGLRKIGVADLGDVNEAIRCIPFNTGGYQLVFNKGFFTNEKEVSARYLASVERKGQVSGTSWPSLAYHDGFHGVEHALCYARYGSSASEFNTAWNSCEIATEIVEEAYSRLKRDFPEAGSLEDLIFGISEYASKNNSETICEAAKDLRASGSNAQLISSYIVEVTRERLNVLR